MYCSGSNTNKESLVHSCVSETILSSASLSQTNQIEAFDTFIVRKVNPCTDSENASNYFTKFSTDSNEKSTFYPDFNFNLNNHTSNLSKILTQSHFTINSNLSEPERLFTTTSQPNPVMSSNSLVSFQPPPYPDPLPDQFFVTLLDFVSPKTQSCIGCPRHSRRYTTDKSIGLHGA